MTTHQHQLTIFVHPDVPQAPSFAEFACHEAAIRSIEAVTRNAWADPHAAIDAHVISLPAAILYEDGVEIGRVEGPRSRRQLGRWMEKKVGPVRTAGLVPVAA